MYNILTLCKWDCGTVLTQRQLYIVFVKGEGREGHDSMVMPRESPNLFTSGVSTRSSFTG